MDNSRRHPVLTKLQLSIRILTLAAALGLMPGGLISGGALLPTAQAQNTTTTTYQPWTGTQQGKATQKLLVDLKAKVAQAETDQAASPDFIADLKKLISDYEAAITVSQAQPFLDNFSDGEFASNPAWKVTAGSWQVDKSGNNKGLVSKIRQQANLNTLLGGLLNPQGTTQQANPQYAAIYTKAKLPGFFTASTKFTSKDRYGGLQLSLYQGASAQNQYRVAYQPGNNQGLVLQRVSASGASLLGGYNGVINLEDGRVHDLSLSRDSTGKMMVLLDGQTAITATDASLSGDFDGILLTNVGGSYWIREIAMKPQP